MKTRPQCYCGTSLSKANLEQHRCRFGHELDETQHRMALGAVAAALQEKEQRRTAKFVRLLTARLRGYGTYVKSMWDSRIFHEDTTGL
jgi:hypothetical protein